MAKKQNIAILLLIALAIVLVIFIKTPTPLSGAIVGTVDVTIVQALSINFITDQDTVTFGSGVVENNCSNATLATNDTSIDPTNCWTGTYPYNSTSNVFEIENDGSLNATVDINGTNASTFIGGGNITSPEFQFYSAEAESGACTANLTTTWTDVNSTLQTLCDDLLFANANDQLYTHLRVVIPEDAFIGTHNATVEFIAS
jgi:hypothetical protein